MSSTEFYQQRLDAVSRSFALCIPQLEPPFRERVALAYLLLRVLDTVEDAPFAEKSTQQRQFERVRAFLRAMPAPAEVDAFVAGFPPQLADGERELLGHAFVLLGDAHALPPPARRAVFRAIDRMAIGMAAYMRRPAPLRLVDGEDVTRYCCFVAGLVGEMLTELWAFDRAEPAPAMKLAYHFGVFLQKVNILKDQRADEAARRFLVPDRTALLASLRDHADGALGYLRALPRAERGYRVFCAWALTLGAAAIARLDGPKWNRVETAELLARTAAIADDDDALRRQFDELMPVLPAARGRICRAKPESLVWFRAALAAPLGAAELAALGVGNPPHSALAG